MNDEIIEERMGVEEVIPEEWENNTMMITYEQYYGALRMMPEVYGEIPHRICEILTQLIAENDNRTSVATAFDAENIPAMSLRDYIRRIAQYSQCSTEALVLALVYIDRYQTAKEGMLLTKRNAHK